MAGSNAINSTNLLSRRKLVKPALPAFTLLPKARKEITRVKEKESFILNDNISEQRSAANARTDLQAGTTTELGKILQEANNGQQPSAFGNLSAQTGHDQAESGDLAAILAVSQPKPVLDIHVSNKPSVQCGGTFGDVYEFGETGSHEDKTFEPVRESLGLHQLDGDAPILLNENHLKENLPEPTVTKTEDPISAGIHTAPEAITGDVEKPEFSYSADPSVSNPSIQHTPGHSLTPLNPEQEIQNQDAVNGISQKSPSFILNGHITPASHTGTPSNVALTSPVQPFLPTIHEHMHHLQFSLEWFDCEICVYFPHLNKPAIYRNAHSLLMIRSARLRSFVYPQRASSYAYYVINLAPPRPIDVHAFDAALRFFYTDTVLSADQLLSTYGAADKVGKRKTLDYAMSYLISGLELGLEPVTTRALDLVGRLLDWDLAETAVKEAYVLRSSTSTSNHHAPQNVAFVANVILQHVFNLIILQVDFKHFKIDADSIPTEVPSRLSQSESSKASVNPVLASMVFGSMPTSINLSPTVSDYHSSATISSPDTIVSNIMLNLEFDDLRILADRMKKMHGDNGMKIVRAVVGERERRRVNVYKNRAVSNKEQTAISATWDTVGWREFVHNDVLEHEHIGRHSSVE